MEARIRVPGVQTQALEARIQAAEARIPELGARGVDAALIPLEAYLELEVPPTLASRVLVVLELNQQLRHGDFRPIAACVHLAIHSATDWIPPEDDSAQAEQVHCQGPAQHQAQAVHLVVLGLPSYRRYVHRPAERYGRLSEFSLAFFRAGFHQEAHCGQKTAAAD